MNNCGDSINEKLVIAATNYVRKMMKIDNALWVFINDGDIFESTNHSGMFQKDIFVIRYNRNWLKIAEDDKVIKCAFHETFHAIQYSAVLGSSMGLKNTIFTDEEIVQLTDEFKGENYNDSNETWGSYLVEQQAERFANELYEIFIKYFNNTEDFVTEYYEMFPNIE